MPKSEDDFRDLAAERAVIAGTLQYGGDMYLDIADITDADSFHDHINGKMWKCFETFFNENDQRKLDIPSIYSIARTLGFQEHINERSTTFSQYVRVMLNYPIEAATVREEAKKLYKFAMMEAADRMAAGIRIDLRQLKGTESVTEITNIFEQPVFDFISRLNEAGSDGPTHIAVGVDEFIQNLIDHPRDNIGISSGFALYDYYIGGGFRRSTVSIVGARMKVGKTILCDNIALHVAGNLGIPVLNLDTEMTREEHLARIICHLCKVRSNITVTIYEFERGYFGRDPVKVKAVKEAAAYLKTIPYEYDTIIGKSFEELVATMRRWVRRRVGFDATGRTNDCLVIYDYLQAPEPGEYGDSFKEYQVLGYQMLSLLKTASKCDVPIFTLVQLNRDGIDKESTSVAADSDRVLRKAANFSILKWKSEQEMAEDGDEKGTHKMVPIIARHGEPMVKGDYINLIFDGKTACITEAGTRNEVSQARKADKKRGTQGFVVDESETEAQTVGNAVSESDLF